MFKKCNHKCHKWTKALHTVCILIQPFRFLVLNGDSILVLYLVLLIQKMLKKYEECDMLVKNNFIYNSNNIYV